MIGAIMTHDAAVLKAREIASRVLVPSAGQNDKAGRFSTEAVVSLGESGLLGLLLPVDFGGSGLGPRTFAVVTATLAEADASVAMVYLMHIVGTATISAARPSAAFQLQGPGTVWDSGPTLPRRLRWTTAKSQPIFSLLMTAQAFRPCSTWCSRFLIWGRQRWRWDCAERQSLELRRTSRARNS